MSRGAPERAAARAAGGLFFAYFALVGVMSPYLALYFDARGMTIAQIGVLMALPQALRIVGPPAWGWAAGRVAGDAWLLRAGAAGAAAACAALAAADGFAGLAAALLALVFATSGVVPLVEAITLRAVAGDAGRYGRVRLWGSVGFIVAVAAGGPLLERAGLRWLPAGMLALCALLAAATLGLPARAAPLPARAPVRLRQRLREPAVALFLVANALMVFAHAGLYAFYSLYLQHHGWRPGSIGLMWAVGVAAEIALFAGQKRLFERFEVWSLLAFSFAASVARFAIVAAAGEQVAWLALAQLLHAATFGLHQSASMTLLHRWFEGAAQARAQAAHTVASYGVGGTLGGLAAAWAWREVAPWAVFALSSAVAAAGWLAVAAARRLDYAGAPPAAGEAAGVGSADAGPADAHRGNAAAGTDESR